MIVNNIFATLRGNILLVTILYTNGTAHSSFRGVFEVKESDDWFEADQPGLSMNLVREENDTCTLSVYGQRIVGGRVETDANNQLARCEVAVEQEYAGDSEWDYVKALGADYRESLVTCVNRTLEEYALSTGEVRFTEKIPLLLTFKTGEESVPLIYHEHEFNSWNVECADGETLAIEDLDEPNLRAVYRAVCKLQYRK